jgi:hypothetical protein
MIQVYMEAFKARATSLMPALHDATNAFQRWRVDSASHRVADLPFTNDTCRASNVDVGSRSGCCRYF